MPKATETGQRAGYKQKDMGLKQIIKSRPIKSFGYMIEHKDFAGHTFHDVSAERAQASVRSALARRFGGLNVDVEFVEDQD